MEKSGHQGRIFSDWKVLSKFLLRQPLLCDASTISIAQSFLIVDIIQAK